MNLRSPGKIIAVIPARGGSKGIPRKNMRLMAGKPLIAHAIDNALACNWIDEVIVTTDSDEVRIFAQDQQGVVVVDRPPSLATDAVTLDPVVFDAIGRWEERQGEQCGVVVTLQPTSPLLTSSTLDVALSAFFDQEVDTLVSVINAPHLSWHRSESGDVVPSYADRLNRQQLPPNYVETGAFLVSRRSCVTASTRFGAKIGVYEVPLEEAVDIDTCQDWMLCESLLKRKNIAFRVDGHKELGLGHIYRALTLAYRLTGHEVVFLCDPAYSLGIEKLRAAHMKVIEVDGDEGALEWVRAHRPDILVNDCLDTTASYIQSMKKYANRVVTFEDLGSGAAEADAVVNALYEMPAGSGATFFGKEYVCLRDEFLTMAPRTFREKVERIVVLFGGTDPLGLTDRLYGIARRLNGKEIVAQFDFILGSGYAGDVIVPEPERGITVYRDITFVGRVMRDADLAISSQGRTTFELASLGVPAIVLAQNERERLHKFAQMGNGFINLGLGSEVSDADILGTIEWLLNAPTIRREMRSLMLECDFRHGIDRVVNIILGEVA